MYSGNRKATRLIVQFATGGGAGTAEAQMLEALTRIKSAARAGETAVARAAEFKARALDEAVVRIARVFRIESFLTRTEEVIDQVLVRELFYTRARKTH